MKPLGRQILAELYGCGSELLDDVAELESRMVQAALDSGATVINTSFHRFSPFGVSGVVVIQESHLSIHTWPEHGFAAVDVFTCGDELNPSVACGSIAKALQAGRCETKELTRGRHEDLGGEAATATSPALLDSGQDPPSSYLRNIWFTEKEDDIALSLRHAGRVFRRQSQIQRVEVLNSYRYGKMLILDGAVAFSETDECVYHEMIVHPAVLTHGGVRRALIIGGGDGGACRELLRHSSVESITVLEIDPVVTEACRNHFPAMAGALDDPRVKLETCDGIAYLEARKADDLDLIVVDAGGTSGAGSPLYSQAFYQRAKTCLASEGILCAQTPRPTLDSDSFRSAFQNQRAAFGPGNVRCYLAFIPSFTTGLVSFSVASRATDLAAGSADPDRSRAFAAAHPLQYYTPAIHDASFVLPGFIEAMLSETH